jgi:two-component system, OmpR family, sensor histidine kinase MprB
MTLRWRVALSVAAITILACVALTVVAFALTSGELVGQLDLNLSSAVAQLQIQPSHLAPGATIPPPKPGSVFLPGSPLPTSSPAGSPPIAAVQHLNRQGAVDNGNKVLAIPIQPVDLQIARAGGSPVTVDETIGGQPYRVLTAPTRGGGALQVAISLAAVNAALHGLLIRFALAGLSVAVVAALAGWLLATRIARPLERLAAGASGVTRTGALAIEGGSTRRDEIGNLTRAIATMLASLRTSREQQQQLVQDAGHELRTPLTSLSSNVELLALYADRLTDAERARLVASLQHEVDGLVTLVNELLELSTDASSSEELAEVDMSRLVRAAADRCSARTGRQVLVVTTPWRVLGFPTALERAVANLLDNATKFSPEGTPVEVDAPAGRVAVHDHGGGIPAEQSDRVFDRFYRLPSPDSKAGSGLGLSIVSKVAAAHGGSVFATNAPDGGAVVGFELPPDRVRTAPHGQEPDADLDEDPLAAGGAVSASASAERAGPEEDRS